MTFLNLFNLDSLNMKTNLNQAIIVAAFAAIKVQAFWGTGHMISKLNSNCSYCNIFCVFYFAHHLNLVAR